LVNEYQTEIRFFRYFQGRPSVSAWQRDPAGLRQERAGTLDVSRRNDVEKRRQA
jgi:hypothetical protein